MISIERNKIIGVDENGNKITIDCDFKSTLRRADGIKSDPTLYEGYGDTGMCRQISYEKDHRSYVGPADLAVYVHNGIVDVGVYINAFHTCNFKIIAN